MIQNFLNVLKNFTNFLMLSTNVYTRLKKDNCYVKRAVIKSIYDVSKTDSLQNVKRSCEHIEFEMPKSQFKFYSAFNILNDVPVSIYNKF